MNIQEQSEIYLTGLVSRKRNPARVSTVTGYRSYLDCWILPRLGSMELAEVGNKAVKGFVSSIQAELAPSTVNTVVNLVKEIVKSAVNEDGDQLFPRTWNTEFMDVPAVVQKDQDAPIITREALQEAISGAIGQDRPLYVMLAATGLRIGELQALKAVQESGTDTYWDSAAGTVTVRSTFARNRYQPFPKTDAGNRVIDLHPEVNAYLKTAGLPAAGWLFRGRADGPVSQSTVGRHLKANGIDEGCHAFRRFRLTHLELQGVPRGIMKLWAGHADGDISDRYVKVESNIQVRKLWAEKAGLGFTL